MTRNLKALGLALFAVFAMSALVASAAQASLTVTPEKYPAILTADAIGNGSGSLQEFITNEGAPVKCTTVGGHATIEKAGAKPPVGDTEITFTEPTYSGCTGPSGVPATVDMKKCDYLFHGGIVDPKDPTHFTGGEVDLVCPAGVTGPLITVYANATKHAENKPACTITVWNFTNKKEVTYTNTATTIGPPHVPNDFDLTAKNVVTNITTTGILCPGTTATYNGEITMTGFEDLNTKPGELPIKEGKRIGVTISPGK